ncbi:MAG: CinA family nicotinamide mononucleotide deamidase-related protein, partial [Proteobacteria bacterium]|nr:CinA family nicotinamide mononucleotide deamidase-related protein [Pseudomonadota bacterium]
MQGEIITIGNELISGRVLDLNAWYAAGRLTASGLRVTRVTTVGDDTEKLSKAITEAVAQSHFVIITGGLGSTEDDLTNEIVAQALNRPLCLDEQMFEQIKSFVDARGIEMSSSLEKMAWMPKDSSLLNPAGNVCGFSLKEKEVRLYFLPGVPDQMRYLMDKFVLPELLLHCKTLPVLRHRILRIYGLSEPNIAELLKGLPKRGDQIILGFYPRFPENHITMSLRGQDEPTVVAELDVMEGDIRALLGPFIFAAGNQSMEEVVGGLLKEAGLSLSVAESCTGGLIGNRLTNVPGSSNYFQGGVVVYSNQSKVDLLGVSAETIERRGAVSEQTAREMAEGVRKKFKTDMGIAVTGIAGPEGGSDHKPVGTVYIALAAREGTFSKR